MSGALSKAHSRLLQAVFERVLDQGHGPRLAEIYGVWTLCFQRFCDRRDKVPTASQVPNFMVEIGRMNVTGKEKDRALDAVMFSLSEVYPALQDTNSPKPPNQSSTSKLLTRLLLETDVKLSEAIRLETANVDVHRGYMRIESRSRNSVVDIPEDFVDAFCEHVLTLRSKHDDSVPLFQAAYDKYVGASKAEQDDAEAATRVMKTLFMHVE